MAKSDHLQQIARMIQGSRWATLATVDEAGLPGASMVAYATDRKKGCLYLHLSSLAAHTRELMQQPVVALMIGECDSGDGDPQQLARLSLRGGCSLLEPGEADYEGAKACYLQALPDAEQRFAFSDFKLIRLVPERARFVGGFAMAHSYNGGEIMQQLRP